MNPGGTAALHRLGVDISDLGRRIDTLEFRDEHGRMRTAIDIAAVGARFGYGSRTVPRRDLLARLASGLPDGTVRFGRACTAPRTDPVGGATADGIGSVLRAHQLPDTPAEPCGWASMQALTPVPVALADGTVSRCVQGPGGMCGIMPAGNGLVQWWFDVPWSPDAAEPASPVESLRARFGRWKDPVAAAILEYAQDTDLGRYPHYRHTVPDLWGHGPVTLLGDAAHAFPPSTAQGANQALEDAWALTRALDPRRTPHPAGPEPLLRRYEHTRRPPAALASRVSSLQIAMRRRPPALVHRMIPRGLATRGFAAYLRRVSTVLGPEPGHRP
ncbi:FAD-dependent oxidoreductase [Nocardiopsis mangrovi]|uniref:FAD-dependent oxidoreductase n=1 Tax=Nocardiopsis mangrovi TaxID=1179818 RepID=A0ABV9DYB0_9ACTN